MSYGQQKISDLSNWVSLYTETLQDQNETRSCLISRQDIESLMKYMNDHEEQIDGIRIYLIRRYDIAGIKKLSNGIPQTTFAIVPTTGFKTDWGAKDYFDNGVIQCIIPGDNNEGSGLCPTTCGETLP
jgi:hypothetical protein